jgi:exonuclease SbcD
MLEEQRHVFGQIIGYIDTEKPDAVLIAGDVYDRATVILIEHYAL